MIESIYEKIKKDFEFLKDFGYNTCSDEHHYIFPSVVFHSQKESIQIGMNYEEKKFLHGFIRPPNNILELIYCKTLLWGGESYTDQMPQVKEFLFQFLRT